METYENTAEYVFQKSIISGGGVFREGKNYRQISKIARISVKDIKPILHKYGADGVSGYAASDYQVDDDIPISSRAYKLFSLQVSIALNLRAPEVKTL
ncbi:MAG: hypothetical protein WBX01_10285 [Nitrososphaeraceae archaeon]|jgi:hypothetical protein